MDHLRNSLPVCTLRDGTTHSRMILGGWQLSEWHSDARQWAETIEAYVRAGVDAIDCADIYTGVEETIGRALEHMTEAPRPRIHTKHVPDLDAIRRGKVTPETTRSLVRRSLERTKRKCLDLVQFHQWDYDADTYKTSIATLLSLRAEGLINGLGVTNCSTAFLRVLEDECGFIPLTTQNQYSIIDRRAETSLLPYAESRGIGLYAYGVVMGGLLSDRYLWVDRPEEPLENRSLRKYLRVLDDWGNWTMFQTLLKTLSDIGRKHNAWIAEIATAWTLGQPGTSAVIVWARHPRHAHRTVNTLGISLDHDDRRHIDEIYFTGTPLDGDCFELERHASRHRDIMKFNLNTPQ